MENAATPEVSLGVVCALHVALRSDPRGSRRAGNASSHQRDPPSFQGSFHCGEDMAKDTHTALPGSDDQGLQKVPAEVPPARLLRFTFVPVVRQLPLKTQVNPRGERGDPSNRPSKAAGQKMTEDGFFKAEVVYIGDFDEGEAGGLWTEQNAHDVSTQEETQAQPFKIKSSYKALAAIPTNTLLLEQQAIDESVENEESSEDNAGKKDILETHSEMCSPSQLRQQSEELYAAIDEVLENPMPMRRSQSAPIALTKRVDPEVPKQFRSFPKSAGRETKYTKPGVIRPAAVIPKLQIEEDAEEFHPNPFRQYLEEILENTGKCEHPLPIVTLHEKEALRSQEVSGGQSERPIAATGGRGSPASPLPSQGTLNQGGATAGPKITITEIDEGDAHPTKDDTLKRARASFRSEQVEAELRETHI